ncbi:MAG: hypothetical protein KDK97_15450 [Verrucomicrobiales bacterium]|nr:hypothetical protein [Verrucomicrobiales bacterium]MCP5556607.1 hypothetical protein [Verrucomicrobiaceae bacterium]
MKQRLIFFGIIGLFFGLVGYIWLSLLESAEINANRRKGGSLSMACAAYAETHNGYYPRALQDLVESNTMEQGALEMLSYQSARQKKEWLYIVPQKVYYDTQRVLLAAPKPSRGRRLIILEHGDSDIVTEAVYDEILAHKHDPKP